jgi:hypothetical protein
MSEKMMGRERCKDKGTSRTVHTEFQKPGAHLQATVFAPKERLTARSAPRMVRKGDARPGKHLSLATFLEKISEKRILLQYVLPCTDCNPSNVIRRLRARTNTWRHPLNTAPCPPVMCTWSLCLPARRRSVGRSVR